MQPSPKSFVLDLLTTIRRGTMPVGALIEAAALFGISGNNLRVALARLLAAGQVTRDERGRYRLRPEASPVSRRLGAWRHPEREVRPWDGGWISAHLERSASRSVRREREKALRLYGFRALTPALAVRPDNLRGGVGELRDELRSLGLPAGDLVFVLRDLDREAESRACRLWDAAGIRGGHRRLLVELRRSERRLRALPIEEAMVESFVLGGKVIRSLVLDPLLPDEICRARERDALAAAMRRYDDLGRGAWAEFLARFDVPHHRNPIHTRLVGEVAALA
ncbi:MAG: PaaX family transcriptional regulator [Candidatus Binatia bacterium]